MHAYTSPPRSTSLSSYFTIPYTKTHTLFITPMENPPFHLIFLISLLLFHHPKHTQSSQTDTLFTLLQLLNYPLASTTFTQETNFCNYEPNPSLTLVCYQEDITQIHISGINNGFPQLPQNFSSFMFFSNLATLPSLKVLSLVSLGLWGPLPSNIGTLSSLEILNISSNYFSGYIPNEISSLMNLQTVILDGNMFIGEIPSGLCSLPLLSVLSLKNNSLSGKLPNYFSKNLRILALSRNNLTGEVPDFRGLTNLQVFDLEGNSFGPHFPKLHRKLISLVLRKNRFRFGISGKLRLFYLLQKLDLSLNEIVGPFFTPLLSLPSLSYLDVSGNKLSGMLFKNTSCNSQLQFVNLSSNRLTGDLPSCLASKNGKRVVLYSGNCLSHRRNQQRDFSFCHNEALAVKIVPLEKTVKSSNRKMGLGLGLVGGLVGGICVLGLVFLVLRREFVKRSVKAANETRLILEKVSPAYTLKQLTDARYISDTMKLRPLGIPPYRTFVLEEIKEATNNFNTSNLMSTGSHGQVYKGRLTDGTLVAIRSLKMRKRHNIQTYTHQIEMISKLRQCHLVSAVGHSVEYYPDDSTVTKIYIVFEFVSNGTLRSWISEGLPGKKFTWTQRLAAAIGVTRGIQFLHTGIVPGLFSNNLRITDVLLDHNLQVKISRYNLPLLAESVKLAGAGFSSIVPKERVQAGLNNKDKNDIYDLGVILLEILVGRPIMSENDITIVKDLLLVSLKADGIARKSIVDPIVQKECSDQSLRTLMEICIKCVSKELIDRPSIEDVLWNLQFVAQFQDSWKGDTKSNQGSPSMFTEQK